MMQRERKNDELVAADEWLGLIPIQSVVSTLHIAEANIAVHRFTAEMPKSSHRFCISTFFRDYNEKKAGI